MSDLTDLGALLTSISGAAGIVALGGLVYLAYDQYRVYRAGIELDEIRNKQNSNNQYSNSPGKPMRWGRPSPNPKRGSYEWMVDATLYLRIKDREKNNIHHKIMSRI